MLADGADISVMERAMSIALEGGLSQAMSRNGMQPVAVESGGFPTVALRKSIGYAPILPVVAFRYNTIVRSQWLRDQSRAWASRMLSDSVFVVCESIIRAASRDGATGVVGIDRSSLRTMFEPTKERDGFQIRFFASLAYDRIDRGDGVVVETTQTDIDLGSFDLGRLPSELDQIMASVRSSANDAASDPGMDSVLEAMMDDDSFEGLMG